MITAKFYKKIPKRIINQCPELMIDHTSDGVRESGEETNWFAFFNENDECVGCLELEWSSYEYVNGMPSWTVFIYLFETCKKFKHKGYAREMVEWLENLPCVDVIELTHVDASIDYGTSRDFWKHMGWKYADKNTNSMRKILR